MANKHFERFDTAKVVSVTQIEVPWEVSTCNLNKRMYPLGSCSAKTCPRGPVHSLMPKVSAKLLHPASHWCIYTDPLLDQTNITLL
jgi:hypothetical protein